jgi:hypothetical protein
MSGFLCAMVGASFTVAAAAEVLRSKKGITAVGNAQVDTAQSKFGGASLLLDGTGDYLSSTTPLSLGTGDWTVELWIRTGTANRVFFDNRIPTASAGVFYLNASGYATYYDNTTSAISGTTNCADSTFRHIAYSKSGTTLRIFVNGTVEHTATGYTQDMGTGRSFIVGAQFDGAISINGHIDEIRISNTARYTTTFTPSTTPFVNDANTLLLIHANGTDGSTFFEDDNGTGRSQNNGRRNSTSVISTTRSKFGGSSIYLPNDYVTFANDIIFPDNQDFTWEFWVNEDVVQNCKYTAGQTPGDIFIGHDSYGNDTYNNRLAVGVVAVGWYMDFGVTLAADTWYHVCVQRSGDTVYGYTDGTLRVTHTGYLANYPWSWRKLQLSGERDGITMMNGYQDEIRFSNIVRYATAGFTAPSAPFQNDANTVLLIHGDGTNASTVFTDDNGQPPFVARTAKTVTAVGNAQIDTAQSKFGGASAQFDGSGDYLTIPASNDFNFGTGNFTIEMWFRRISGGAIDIIVGNRGTGFVSGNFAFYTYSSSIEFDYRNDLIANNTLTTSISNNIWYHFAIVRNGTSLTLYKDGAVGQAKTIGSTETFGSSSIDLSIGCNTVGTFPLNGYIDELRISNTARYTTTFTPSTAPFVNDPNTVLLIHADGADATTTFTDDNISYRTKKGITAIGNAQIDTAQSKFGGAAAQFDGNGDYLLIRPLTEFAFGTNNFTIEFWLRVTTISLQYQNILDMRTAGSQFASVIFLEYGVLKFGDGYTVRITNGSNLSINTWYHIAVSRSATSTKMFVDGTQVGSTYSDSANYIAPDFAIGANFNGAASVNGHMDEVRISNTARYTTTFTPSTTPFQNDANTVLLLHMDGTDASTTFTDDNGIAPYTP